MNRYANHPRIPGTRTPCCATIALMAVLMIVLPLEAQITPRLDARLGFLATGGDTFSDRPFVQLGGALEFGTAQVGSPPVLAVTTGIVAEFGDIFAASMTMSWRFLAGIETAWALADGVDGGAPRAEFVPSIQVGYQTDGGRDGRSGLTIRAGPGVRIPLDRDGRTLLTFEPVSVVLLPGPDDIVEDKARIAWELGILKMGFRF